eukprot:5156597-Prymnesium_polylepis.2
MACDNPAASAARSPTSVRASAVAKVAGVRRAGRASAVGAEEALSGQQMSTTAAPPRPTAYRAYRLCRCPPRSGAVRAPRPAWAPEAAFLRGPSQQRRTPPQQSEFAPQIPNLRAATCPCSHSTCTLTSLPKPPSLNGIAVVCVMAVEMWRLSGARGHMPAREPPAHSVTHTHDACPVRVPRPVGP